MAELAKRFPAGHGSYADARHHRAGDRGRVGDRQDAARGDRPGGAGGLHLPAELAGDADPDPDHPGLAGGRLHVLSRRSDSRSTRSRCWGWCWRSAWWSTTRSSWSRRSSAKIEQGQSPRDAALEAMDEVGGALVGIALVLSAVFIPAAFMAGITGSLYRQFALTIAFSVIISAFNALTLSPALGALLLRPKSGASAQGTARARLRALQRGLRAGDKGLRQYLRPAHPKVRAGARDPGGLRDPGGRNREGAAAIVPARRGPGLLHNQRRAAGSRLAAAHGRGDAEDRRYPEA